MEITEKNKIFSTDNIEKKHYDGIYLVFNVHNNKIYFHMEDYVGVPIINFLKFKNIKDFGSHEYSGYNIHSKNRLWNGIKLEVDTIKKKF